MNSEQHTALRALFPNESIIELWSQDTPTIMMRGKTVATGYYGTLIYFSVYGLLFLTLYLSVTRHFIPSVISLVAFMSWIIFLILNRNNIKKLAHTEIYIALCLTDKSLYIIDQRDGRVIEQYALSDIRHATVTRENMLQLFSPYVVELTIYDGSLGTDVIKTYRNMLEAADLPKLVHGLQLYNAKHEV
jgi:hypothetical protein